MAQYRLDLLDLNESLALILVTVTGDELKPALVLQIHNGLHHRRVVVAQFQPELATGTQVPTSQVENQSSHPQSIGPTVQGIKVLIPGDIR